MSVEPVSSPTTMLPTPAQGRSIADPPAVRAIPPIVSVILVTRNRPEMLREAVDSVLAQTERRFELIVVDDAGSTHVDVGPDPRIRVIRREARGGPAASRNTGSPCGARHVRHLPRR